MEDKDATKALGLMKIMADERMLDEANSPRDSKNVERLIRGFKLKTAYRFLLRSPMIIVNTINEEDMIRTTR
jgi:hypothetical protein